jgi:beta-lactamase regulating signal transducer with metallopeptidase domain
MNDLFLLAVHNTIVVLVLALFVHALTRVWRSPPVAHVLWLLLLLKLVTPPVVRVEWSALWAAESTPATGPIIADVSRIEGLANESDVPVVDQRTAVANADAAATSSNERDFAARVRLLSNRVRPIVFWLWLAGAVVCALVAGTRIVRFERVLRGTLPAPERLHQLALEIAGKFAIRQVPDLRYVDSVETPLLWCAGHRPTIVLPLGLLRELDEQQAAMILAHELAHLRRRDHWVRALELLVSTLYWWNPLVWVIRRRIHQAEDLCCDAWVRRAFPNCARRYAEVVLKTAEWISEAPVHIRLLPASPFLNSLSLKARIEMILESRFAPSISPRSVFAIALLAILVLPLFIQTTRMEAVAGSKEEPPAPSQPAGKPDPSAHSEFPYVLKFEQGPTRFEDGDQITILEVRGTADAMTRGDIYCIKGAYTLASHDRARLSASVTARDAANGRGTPLKVQSTVVNRGSGNFTLFLPMVCDGWPHVSFYPADRGSSFGGNYFGTGDSVLKQWWSTNRSATAKAPGATPSTELPSVFPHVVKFEQGATRFETGDKITILEVRGTADTMTPGHTYRIKGTYTLASHDRATLAAYTTASKAANGTGPTHKVQSTVVHRGTGTFTLVLPMSCEGWPHLSFYPADGGSDFGGNYFGTGDWVLKKWWGTK